MECENCKKLQRKVDADSKFRIKLLEQKKQVQEDLNTALKELKVLKAEQYKLKTAQRKVKIAKEALELQLKAEEKLGEK